MRRIIFLNRFYWPDESATSQMLTDLATGLAAAGHDVTVVTSRSCLNEPERRLGALEQAAGVKIHRVSMARSGRGNLAGRTLAFLGFLGAAVWRLLRVARPGDVIIAKTDPPMLSVPAAVVARLRGASMVTWQQDLYPETAAALGVIGARAPLFRFLKALRNRSLRQANENVVISDTMAARLQREGIPAARIRVIPNWADGDAIRPVAPADNPLRREWIGDDAFVVGYSGNMGRAHDLEPVLEAARRLQDRDASPPIRFLLVGEGFQARRLAGMIAEKPLGNVTMRPFQPRQGLRHSLGVADLHVVSLRPELEGLVVPSKIFGALAAGRPVLYLGDRGSEIAAWLGKAGCGTVCAPDRIDSIVDAVLAYARSPARLAAEGHAARALFDERFSRDRALADWREMIDQL